MCAEAAKGLEPFDRKVPRSLFLECGEGACRAQVMLDRGYTPTAGTTAQLTGGECAAVLLALLLQTEASVPPANASAAGRAVDPGREQRRRARRRRSATRRSGCARRAQSSARRRAKAWPPSCAAPVRSLLSESPGLCSPLVELRAARAAAIAAKRTHSRIKKRGGNITIIDSEEAWGDCRRDERGGWGGNDDHGEPIVARAHVPPAVRRPRQLPLLVVVGHHARVLLVAPVRRAAGAADGSKGSGARPLPCSPSHPWRREKAFASSYTSSTRRWETRKTL